MGQNEIQIIIDMAVKIATRSAMSGNPVEGMTWIPPSSATQDWRGSFAVKECPPLSATDTPPWEC